MLWGEPRVIEQRLGAAVESIAFRRETMLVPALSLAHFRTNVERAAGPMIKADRDAWRRPIQRGWLISVVN